MPTPSGWRLACHCGPNGPLRAPLVCLAASAHWRALLRPPAPQAAHGPPLPAPPRTAAIGQGAGDETQSSSGTRSGGEEDPDE